MAKPNPQNQRFWELEPCSSNHYLAVLRVLFFNYRGRIGLYILGEDVQWYSITTIIYNNRNKRKMQQINYKPLKHILVCTNERGEGKECCSNVKGYEIFRELKDWTKANGLASSVLVTRTGCLGFCNSEGATVVIYPDQLCFKEVKKEEVEQIKQLILDSLK